MKLFVHFLVQARRNRGGAGECSPPPPRFFLKNFTKLSKIDNDSEKKKEAKKYINHFNSLISSKTTGKIT